MFEEIDFHPPIISADNRNARTTWSNSASQREVVENYLDRPGFHRCREISNVSVAAKQRSFLRDRRLRSMREKQIIRKNFSSQTCGSFGNGNVQIDDVSTMLNDRQRFGKGDSIVNVQMLNFG